MWCIPPEQNAEFVGAMENVLEVYHRPYDARCPVVCMEETRKPWVRETRVGQPVAPGHEARIDYEYERNGTANVFLFVEPLDGWRKVNITDRRTRCDGAGQIKELVDVPYPEAETITLVQDNLNTHHPSSLYEAFTPEEARRLIDKLEIVYTPKHGSWLNIAEIELGILNRQCMKERIGEKSELIEEVGAWELIRNDTTTKIDWQFTTADARIKLRRLYPKLEVQWSTSTRCPSVGLDCDPRPGQCTGVVVGDGSRSR
jgi:hypothetical protein